jgi:hypothetical protein
MKRAVRSLIRVIAFGLAIFGILEIGLEIARQKIHAAQVEPPKSHPWQYVIGAGLILAAIILFAGSDSLAEQLTDDVDDEPPPTDKPEE